MKCDDRGMVVGLISDTHGLVRPEVFAALHGVELILHAGDVGGAAVRSELEAIAPTLCVFGNTDSPDEPGLKDRLRLALEGVSVLVTHGHELGRPTPDTLLARYDADVIVYGHTHRALIERHGTRLVVNPGAAGPRRFDVNPSVARLTLDAGRADASLIRL